MQTLGITPPAASPGGAPAAAAPATGLFGMPVTPAAMPNFAAQASGLQQKKKAQQPAPAPAPASPMQSWLTNLFTQPATGAGSQPAAPADNMLPGTGPQ